MPVRIANSRGRRSRSWRMTRRPAQQPYLWAIKAHTLPKPPEAYDDTDLGRGVAFLGEAQPGGDGGRPGRIYAPS